MPYCDHLCHFVTLSICVVLILGSLAGFITLSFYQEQGCPKVESCTYDIISYEEQSDNSTLYTFFYVINNQYMCLNFCSNPLDSTSCPLNGSSCDVTDEVRDFCRYHGFAYLFEDCTNTRNLALLFLCLFAMFICAISAVPLAKATYRTSPDNPSRTTTFPQMESRV